MDQLTGHNELMKLALTLLMLITALSALADRPQRGPFPEDREMRPFSTDGCTMAPEGTLNRPNLFRPCCIAHDLRFWGGGTEAERDHADLELRACIRKVGGPGWATIFYNAVRAGRLSPWTIESKRWGNAWYELDGYRSLNAEEIQRLIEGTRLLGISEEIKNAYILELEARSAN